MSGKVAVIGAGIGGLCAALDLGSRGFRVDLYEKNDQTGGKAGCLEEKGFTFDTGPSLLTMPFVFEKLLKKAGKDPKTELPMVELDVICKYFFSDGTVLNAYSDGERLLEEFGAKTLDDKKTIKEFLYYCEKIYENAKDFFLFNSLENFSGVFKKDPLKGLRAFAALDIFRTLHKSHQRFFKDPNTIQLFDRYATYSGSDPFKIPATLNIIPHVEYGIGAFAPRYGIRAIPRALTKAAEENGVNFLLGGKVEKILLEGKQAKGLIAGGREVFYDIVVSNADVNTTYRDLLDNSRSNMGSRYLKAEPSSSAIVFYWGMNKVSRDLEANNIFFSSDYRKEFMEIFDKGICPSDPTVYVNISSKYCPEDAPQNCENWFVLVNVPYDRGQDWAEEAVSVKKRVLSVLKQHLREDVGENIVFESVMTPKDIFKNTLSNKGSIYGISSNSRLAAYYRQPNRSQDYKGLYFCGGSAHPGGGMPLVALSGTITADLVELHDG